MTAMSSSMQPHQLPCPANSSSNASFKCSGIPCSASSPPVRSTAVSAPRCMHLGLRSGRVLARATPPAAGSTATGAGQQQRLAPGRDSPAAAGLKQQSAPKPVTAARQSEKGAAGAPASVGQAAQQQAAGQAAGGREAEERSDAERRQASMEASSSGRDYWQVSEVQLGRLCCWRVTSGE